MKSWRELLNVKMDSCKYGAMGAMRPQEASHVTHVTTFPEVEAQTPSHVTHGTTSVGTENQPDVSHGTHGTTSVEVENQPEPPFVANVTTSGLVEPAKAQEAERIARLALSLMGGGTARIIPPDVPYEHGQTWDEYMAGQRNRIFRDAREQRRQAKLNPEPEPKIAATAFQRSFFDNLSRIEFEGNQAKFVRVATALGIPREASEAYLRVNKPLACPRAASKPKKGSAHEKSKPPAKVG